MTGNEPSGIRVSDGERESALNALGEHMRTGRLTVDEYGDRSARVATAKTRGELLALFTDLPGPHPVFGPTASPPTSAQSPPAAPEPLAGHGVPARSRAGALIPAIALISLGLFLVIHLWWVFLLVPAAVVLGRIVWGDDRPRRGGRYYGGRRSRRYRGY